MRLLDLFCGAGGCAVGYARAGFDEIVGVDINPQPRYPFEFVRGDALDFVRRYGHDFDVIHASPPCQAYTRLAQLYPDKHYPDFIPETRAILLETGGPYVIENVPGSPLRNPLLLCGTMFGLRTQRHRWFETSPQLVFSPSSCAHVGKATGSKRFKNVTRNVTFSDGFEYITVCGHGYNKAEGELAMGIDWMTRDELSQAIPPAYTQYVGEQILKSIGGHDDL